MFHLTPRPVAAVAAYAGMLIALALLSSPASAIDGRTAVGICIDSTASGAHCAWSVNDKGEIDICNKNDCVYCPSATEQCTVAKNRPRPSRALPVGATVKTPMGLIDVTSRSFSGRCPAGERRCRSFGCLPLEDPCPFRPVRPD